MVSWTSDPAFDDLRSLHPQKLVTSKKKLFRFLTHWLSGPKLLTRIPPRAALLELRHCHFELNEERAKLWLAGMNKAMSNLEIESTLKEKLNSKFAGMIRAMQQQRTTINNSLFKKYRRHVFLFQYQHQ